MTILAAQSVTGDVTSAQKEALHGFVWVARQAPEGVLPHQAEIPAEGAVAWGVTRQPPVSQSLTSLPTRRRRGCGRGGKVREGGRVAAFRAGHSRSVAPGGLPLHPRNSVRRQKDSIQSSGALAIKA